MLKSFLNWTSFILRFRTNKTTSPIWIFNYFVREHVNWAVIFMIQRIFLDLVVEQFFCFEMQLEFSGNLLVEWVPLIIQNRSSFLVSNVNKHICIGLIFFVSFHQNASRVWVIYVRLSFKFEAAYLTSNALSKCVFFCNLSHSVVIEFIPSLF